VFEVGDDGIVAVLRPEVDDGAVEDAVRQCPTQALSSVD
jgi:ferredoxin